MDCKHFLSVCIAFVSTLVLAYAPALAAPVGYTDSATFIANLPMPASTLNFESMSAGATIDSGDTVEGVTFTYDFGSVKMMVSDAWDTTSPSNFLGTDDGDILQDGDDFDLSFSEASAIGMYFITADDVLDDDIALEAAGFTVGLDASQYDTLGDGSRAFFLGIIDVDPGNAFTAASIGTIGGGYFLYNVDDITTAVPVPEPASVFLVGTGLLGILGFSRPRRS
jgi:hypothetical protein